MSELCDLSAVELRRLITRKEITPLEVLESCHARIDEINPRVNAVVAEDRETARENAAAAGDAVLRGDPLGLLHGLPVGIKDLVGTKGLRTTQGSPIFATHVPERDEPQVANLRRAGAVIAGKTNTPEFGAGANTDNAVYGFTGNPFDPQKTAAGSSGGSAVALACSMLPLATGSDLGGSLRTPAAFNGVVGLRPTAGRVPNTEDGFAFVPLSVEGPMARSVADLALFFAAMVDYDRRDPHSRPVSWEDFIDPAPADLSQVRVAISEDLGFAPIAAAQRSLFRERVDSFKHLFLEADRRDPEMGDATFIFEALRGVSFLSGLGRHYDEHRDLLGPNVLANIELGLGLSARQIGDAMAGHARLYRRFLKFVESVDVLICPTAAVTPFGKAEGFPKQIDGEPLETYISWIGITYGLTLAAHPVLALPCGVDEQGMPFGLQLVGKRHGEARLLAIGRALEAELSRIRSCQRPLPDLKRLL